MIGTTNAVGSNVTADMLGIVIKGNSTPVGALAKQYVIVKNSTISDITDGLYTATKIIPANTAIDSTYLTPSPDGGFNSLLSDIKGLTAVRQISMAKNSTYINNTGKHSARIVGEHIVFISLNFQVFKEVPSENIMFSGLPKPAYETAFVLAADTTVSARAFVKADGTIRSDGVVPKDRWYNASVSYYV